MGSRIDVSKRLWEKIAKGDDDECWPWTGKCDSLGYGRINMPGDTTTGHRQALAHRVTYEITTGENIDGKVIRHRCDNPSCCNPRHLVTGTQADNIEDMISRGRHSQRKGEHNGRAILSEHDVSLIKARIISRESIASIARAFCVGHSTILHIKAGDTWGWVNATTEASPPAPSNTVPTASTPSAHS